jgi:hypothetical protein
MTRLSMEFVAERPKGPTGKIVKREIAPGEPVMKTATSDQGEVAIHA